MKFITSKLNIDISNYHINSLTDTLILYSKNNTELKIQFDNKLELTDFICQLNIAYHNNDLIDEINDLEDNIKKLHNQLYLERSSVDKYEAEINELKNKLSSIRDNLEATINEYL